MPSAAATTSISSRYGGPEAENAMRTVWSSADPSGRAKPLRIYGRHILPNIASALIVQFTLNFPSTILLETSLSFLGLGIQPPLTSLGQMLGQGRDYLVSGWWVKRLAKSAARLATAAGLACCAIVRGPSMLAAALRQLCLACGTIAGALGYRYFEYREPRPE